MKRMSIKSRKKLIAGDRECFERWKGVELMTVVEWYVSGVKDLRCIGREFHKRGEELRIYRSAN